MMKNNTHQDKNGLKAVLDHNETAQPNDDLLNTLKATIPQFFDQNSNFKTDKFEDELKNNNIAEARDGYKLGFVGKDYARLQVGRKSETMMVPDCKHNALPQNAKSGNIFITGDNLDALRHLVNAYENQVKLMYIDPPYNTGEEFVYSDRFEFNDEKLKFTLGYSDEEITRLKSIQGKSSHSAWLTFMYPRLRIARRLLKEDGVIFVSIDDNEQANLKLLMDDVFGEGNFVAKYVHKNNSSKNQARLVSVSTEYFYCYAKNENILKESVWRISKKGVPDIVNLYNKLKQDNLSLENILNEIKDMYKRPKYAHLSRWNKLDEKGIFVDADLSRENGYKDFTIINPYTNKPCVIPPRGWGKNEEELKRLQKEDLIWYGDENTPPRMKDYIDVDEISVPDSFWYFDNSIDTRWIKTIFGKLIFENPKPMEMIKTIADMCTNKTDLIFDFFAGSATTAHAVMMLNVEDGGNRKFIMVQLDEKTKADSEARKAGYNTIDEIARKRINLAGERILADYESDFVKQTNGWDKDIGFKHYRLITPDVKTLEKIVEFKPGEANLIADDMITPFEYKKTGTSGLDTILSTWLIDDGFRFDTPVEEIVFGNYKAYYVREALKLYLINMGWDTKALINMLNQIGKNILPVSTIVVYPYSFEFETMRELKTNIKTNLDTQLNLIERF